MKTKIKKRALLINPWIHDFAAYDLWSKPLGILKIASFLKQLGLQVSLVDCLDRFHPALEKFLKGKLPRTTIFGDGQYYTDKIEKPPVFREIPRAYKRYGLPKELFRQLVKKEPTPDVILVSSAMTYWYPGVFEAIKILRQEFGQTPIILGGTYARLCYEHARANSGADFVYNGNSLPEITDLLSKAINTSLDYSGIDEDKIFPAYELYSELSYITLRTSSGCPFRCSYCGWWLLDKEFKQQDAEVVVGQIEHFYKKGVRNFSFYDDALLYNPHAHITKILKKLISKGIKAFFHTPGGLHVQFITPELANLFKQAGFIQPRLGLETVFSERQQESGAKTTNKQFLEAVECLKGAGYKAKDIAANIMIGLPQQGIEEIRDSIEFVANTGCRINLEEYAPVPYTPDYIKSGLPQNADPLLHNNSAFPLYAGDYQKFQAIKDHAHKLNRHSRESGNP
ncbi:MAG: B12-binding domain-containing radical SAM protein [Candidatus Omnitrophota bacterium]